MFLIQTYTIQDCYKYLATPSTINDFTFPNEFKLELTVKRTASSGGDTIGVLHLWETNSQTVSVGVFNQTGNYGLGRYTGSWTDMQIWNSIPLNTDVILEVTYQNGLFSVSNGSETKQLSHVLTNPIVKLEIENKAKCLLSDMKIKPL